MSVTHVGGYAGKRGTREMQERIGKLRRRVTELEELHAKDKANNRRLSAENAKLRELARKLVSELCEQNAELHRENAKLRELATYALKHIIEAECEALDRERFRGKPCEDCAEYGSSDCPKCMPRMFDVSGIEVD